MDLTGSSVKRGLVLLEPDRHGVLTMALLSATVGIARCRRCGTRRRVLPCDVLPRKTYGLAAIEHEVAACGKSRGANSASGRRRTRRCTAGPKGSAPGHSAGQAVSSAAHR